MKLFNADEITIHNFEGVRKCVKRRRISYFLQINFQEGFSISTPQGVMIGESGDYLIIDNHGDKDIYKKDEFNEVFEVLEDEKATVTHRDPSFFSSPDRMTATETIMTQIDKRVLDVKEEIFQIERHLSILKSLLSFKRYTVQENVNIQKT